MNLKSIRSSGIHVNSVRRGLLKCKRFQKYLSYHKKGFSIRLSIFLMMGYVFLVISLSCDLFCLNAALGILKTLKILVRNKGYHTKTYSTILNVSFLPRECVWKLLQKGKGRATYTIFWWPVVRWPRCEPRNITACGQKLLFLEKS